MSINQYLHALPPFYKKIIGDITLPHNDGSHLVNILQSGNTIWSYTDGAVEDVLAAHSYILICGEDIKSSQIYDMGKTTGDPKTICSLRSCHSGAIASLILVHYIPQIQDHSRHRLP